MAINELPRQNRPEIDIGQLSIISSRLRLLKTGDKPVFVHISGASGAGKTTCSQLLADSLEGCDSFE